MSWTHQIPRARGAPLTPVDKRERGSGWAWLVGENDVLALTETGNADLWLTSPLLLHA